MCLFSAFADARDLHSFPTRRSSDLKEREPPDQSRTGAAVERLIVSQSGDDAGKVVALLFAHVTRPGFSGPELLGALDRKSTRLNSSHLGTSYAVFCLKKKTKTTTRN